MIIIVKANRPDKDKKERRCKSSIGGTELTPFLGGISLRWGGIN